MDVGLENTRVVRPGGVDGRIEVVLAAPARRSFPPRMSAGLGICLKEGGTHDITVGGRRTAYPAGAVSVRAPGCVWASPAGVHGFLAVDIAPELLPELRGEMGFLSQRAMPGFVATAHRLARADGMEAEELAAQLTEQVVATGALRADGLGAAGGARGAIDDARDFLAANLAARPTLDDVATAAGVDKFTLLRRFRRTLGTTPHAYLVMLRLAHAQALLAAGAPPAEAALDAGFADQAHLGRWFRRALGVTPGAYARAGINRVPDTGVAA